MYNRYIPQNDGSFRKDRISGSGSSPSKEAIISEPISLPPPAPSPAPEPVSSPVNHTPNTQPEPARKPQGAQEQNLSDFLHQLLPQNFDTADLTVVLLLLLMSEKSKDGPNNALLTLVIYLFL